MFELLVSFLKGSVEWQGWGWNIPTVGALGAASFAAFQGIGIWKQGRRVHREREAPTLSFLMFGYSMAYFFAASLYGWEKGSIIITLLGAIGFLHIPVLTGILRYGTASKGERWVVGSFFALIPLMWFATRAHLHEELYLVSLYGLLGFVVPQARKAWRSIDTSDLDPTMILSFVFGAVFWFVYAFAIDSVALKAFNPPAMVLWTFIFIMWWMKGRLPKENEDDSGDALMAMIYIVGGVAVCVVVALVAGVTWIFGFW